ncbi:MAG: FAD-dependent oxidoreductase [Fimbriimonadaceae bacterium]
MATVLILGGGFGGAVAATRLKERLGDQVHITLIDKEPSYHICATNPWVMIGHAKPKDVTVWREGLAKHTVLVQAEVTAIDPRQRKVTTSRGEFQADYLIVALGADLNMSAVPGLAEHAESFFTTKDAEKLHKRLQEFQKGNIVVLVPRSPFKCPPSPYEAAMLLDDFFAQKGIHEGVRVSVWSLEGAPMATAGPEIGATVVGLLKDRGIEFHPRKRTVSVEAGKVNFEDGSSTAFELLIAVPPHEPPGCIKDSGLTGPSGWIHADPKTLKVAGFERVFAVGDVTTVPLPGRFAPDAPLVMPKAGVMAETEAIVVADNIADEVQGVAPSAVFDGAGYCYIETGGGEAMRGNGQFFASPNPTMTSRAPDREQAEEKKRWVKDWLAKYM